MCTVRTMTLCSLEMHLLLTFMSFQFKIELDILFEGQNYGY